MILELILMVGAAGAAGLAKKRAAAFQGTGYQDGVAFPLKLTAIDGEGHMLRADAALAFFSMRKAARADGVELVVNTAFRTQEEQEDLYQQYLRGFGSLAAQPGFSNHQGGIAVDVQTGNGTSAAYTWLQKNAARFGFKRTVSSEPWHWEYRPAEVKA